jgi:hypothetical protein
MRLATDRRRLAAGSVNQHEDHEGEDKLTKRLLSASEVGGGTKARFARVFGRNDGCSISNASVSFMSLVCFVSRTEPDTQAARSD